MVLENYILELNILTTQHMNFVSGNPDKPTIFWSNLFSTWFWNPFALKIKEYLYVCCCFFFVRKIRVVFFLFLLNHVYFNWLIGSKANNHFYPLSSCLSKRQFSFDLSVFQQYIMRFTLNLILNVQVLIFLSLGLKYVGYFGML